MNAEMTISGKMSNLFSTLSKEAMKELDAITIRKEIKKGDVYLEEGGVHEHIIFIDSGLLRFYYFKKNKEVTVHFGTENTLAICDESFFHRRPSKLLVAALEDTVVYEVPYREFMVLVDIYPDVGLLYRKILELLLLESRNKISMFRFETAQGRYLRLLNERPGLINRIPMRYLASYLIMSKETLSRVRSGIFSPEN